MLWNSSRVQVFESAVCSFSVSIVCQFRGRLVRLSGQFMVFSGDLMLILGGSLMTFLPLLLGCYDAFGDLSVRCFSHERKGGCRLHAFFSVKSNSNNNQK